MATRKPLAKKRPSSKAKATARPRPGARRQPETLRLRGLSPSFTATDLQRSIAFYRDVLGFVIGDSRSIATSWDSSSVTSGARTAS